VPYGRPQLTENGRTETKMRYCKIEINGGSTVFTSYANGQNIRGALQVELDIPVAPFHSPNNAGALKEKPRQFPAGALS
jgi:hypothetical protein